MYNLKLSKEETSLLLSEIPQLNRQMLTYLRKEKDGFYSFYSASGLTSDMVTNRVAVEILNLCDHNEMTVNSLLEKLSAKYPAVSKERLLNDLAYTLSSFSKMSIITWKGINPFMKRERIVGTKYTIHLCAEEDIRCIKTFIQENCNRRDIINITPSQRQGKSYSDEIGIRYKLFSNLEDFIFIKDTNSNDLIGIVSISMLGEVASKVCAVGIIFCPQDAFEATMSSILDLYKKICIKKINKIKIVSDESCIQSYQSCLLKAGFVHEATLCAEAIDGGNVLQYSYFFN